MDILTLILPGLLPVVVAVSGWQVYKHVGRLGRVVAQLAAETLHDRVYHLRSIGVTVPATPRAAMAMSASR